MEPVIIVGAGPVGLAFALALARHDVPSVVLDAGDGRITSRPARSCVLRTDTAAFVQRLVAPTALPGARWVVWRTLRRGQVLEQEDFTPAAAPVHTPQHALCRTLRAAARTTDLVRLVDHGKLVELVQDGRGITARTTGEHGDSYRGSYLVGCDGLRSTVRKLLGVRFPGRTAVERHAVAALRTELPWPEEALLHQEPPGPGGEVCARSLPGGVWRLDWLLPARGDLVTPDALLRRVHETLGAWTGMSDPPYELLDTGVHTNHQRLARHWRGGRAFLAGDAAHLLGALGTQSVDEGLRDADNLAWKLAMAWHGDAGDELLDSYEAERRTAVVARLRAVDQALPLVRTGGPLRTLLPGGARGRMALLTDGHLGRGTLGATATYPSSSLTAASVHDSAVLTAPGERAVDIALTAPNGSRQFLSECLGGQVLVVLVAPGTAVWDSRHWMHAGLMPELAAAVRALPVDARLLVAESYPGAAAHTVLVVRPDGYLAAALPGVRGDELGLVVRTLTGAPGPAEAQPGVHHEHSALP